MESQFSFGTLNYLILFSYLAFDAGRRVLVRPPADFHRGVLPGGAEDALDGGGAEHVLE